MQQHYLIDTCIWIDLYEDRKGYNGELLGKCALRLFSSIAAKESKVVITDAVIRELEDH